MNWKTDLQVRDLDASQKLEATCKKCGHVRYLKGADLMKEPGARYKYVDEVERETKCKLRGCSGAVRLALVRDGDASGFVGGLA